MVLTAAVVSGRGASTEGERQIMKALHWKHDKSLPEINSFVRQYLASSGYLDRVRWEGNSFSASVGMGIALNLKGEFTADEIVIERCSGAAGPIVLSKIREALQKAFPNGETTLPPKA